MSKGSNEISKDFLRVAKCGRVVGLKGEISLWPISNVEQRYEIGSELFLENGQSLVIEKIRIHKDHYVAKFQDRSRREDVETLTNEILFGAPLQADVLDEGEFFVHDCVGKNLIDQNGNDRGRAVKFIPNAASDLLETDGGVLVPFRFITRVDEDNVYLEAPEGLFDVDDKDYS